MESPLSPFKDWLTVDQAIAEVNAARADDPSLPTLDPSDLRRQCRQRFGPAELAAFITKDGIKTGGRAADYTGDPKKGGGRGFWLIHRQALESRMQERRQEQARGRGNPLWKNRAQQRQLQGESEA